MKVSYTGITDWIGERTHPPVASAVVEKPEWDPDHVYAWKPAKNWKGWKLIDKEEDGVNVGSVIQSALDVKGVVVLKDIVATVTPLKIYGNTHVILQNCKLTLANGSNDSLFKVYDAINVKISGIFELNGNKANQTTEPSSGIRVLANAGAEAKVEIEGVFEIHDFLSQGIDIVATSTSRTVVTLRGNIKTYNNGRNGIYVGYNAELYHEGYLETYSNGGVDEGDGVTCGDIANKVVLDKVYAHDNVRAGVSVWKTSYVKINMLEAYKNSLHGLYLERHCHDIFVDFIYAYENAQDGIYLINSTTNPKGEFKNINIKGVLENNTRRGITLAYDTIDMSNVFLELVLRNNRDRGIQSSNATYKLKYSIIKFESVGNTLPDLIDNKDATTKIIAGGWFNKGTATFSGDGTTTQFAIPHGLVTTPSNVQVTPKSADATGPFYVTADATYIYVNYLSAPPAGTNNIVLDWKAEV